MLSLVIFLTGCYFVATVHAACVDGPYSAEKSVFGPGSGKYYLVKSTYPNENDCVYVVPPPKGSQFPAKYPFGFKQSDGTWYSGTGEVNVDGPNILDKDEKYGQTNTTLVYSDYKDCDVGLFHGSVGGPHVELWRHSSADENGDGFKCCKEKFEEELKKQKKESDVKDVGGQKCDYPNTK
uniref:Moubatin-like 1 n=1 Tax=Ornithodoros parkeri TaxID=140564 RepID=A6N9L4_ORNPR|nr:moubatin-like 1 [Ornithodoros parkeri]